MTLRWRLAAVCVLAVVAGCGTAGSDPGATPGVATSTAPPSTGAHETRQETGAARSPTHAPHKRVRRTQAPDARKPPTRAPRKTRTRAPRDESRFWVRDRHYYTSPWFAGAHQIMIGFGCTKAPYYDPDPTCPHGQGSHHGIDVAMPCGTNLYAGIRGTVVDPSSAGAPGPAYGPYAFRVRSLRKDVDIVIGHVRRVYVRPGDHVRPGERIARASDAGAPDGCHLHFEVRPAGGSVTDAVNPRTLLRLTR